jgi:hypothetical protein
LNLPIKLDMEMLPRKNLIFIFILLLFNTLQISSQSKYEARKLTWDFSISSGYFFGGPSNKLDDFLNSTGYNWELMRKNYLPLLFDINKAISSNLRVGLNICIFKQDLLWETNGWSNSNFNTVIVNPYLSYSYKGIVTLDAGPSINRVSFFHSTGTSLEDDETHLKAGFILKSNLKYPQKTRLYFQFETLYSYGGTISPYYHIENSTHQYTYPTLHVDNLPINVFYVGFGLGIRLYKKIDKCRILF